ncbi:DUF2809 domain-containing protein [Flavobacteriaceae bacterium S0825]|uniref:ribosomal maturation YjgA family protein n=1 Tax=Gaetbulibacter sp. S0825 TaxID=2720084 RepID=UPI0014315E04|nr:DUF2809 domain-containing protein [Gaetbulibacter sp. S0825]MCK0110305.1 DUF2809 domain-containing protein [Flavobacteriaceae bacterium S0825]NIX65934.1 DUF2809 domain-containing protein [Gaetbulibacter sp. S0825]
MKFSKIYFILFLMLFTIEAYIAYFLKSGFIRHTFGDFLVVIMLYCLFKSFIDLKPITLGLIVLSIAFIVEFLQLTPLLELMNLQDNKTAKIIFGSTFHVSDLLAYTLGIMTTIIIEKKLNND